MQGKIESQNRLSYQEFEALRSNGLVVEEEFQKVESVVIFDGVDNNRRVVEVETQIMFSGIGKNRRAITVFIPDRKMMGELMGT